MKSYYSSLIAIPSLAVLLGLTACSSKTNDSSNSRTSRPNVVIIYADDMGHGDISVQNPLGKIITPHLDRLASQGMRFTDGHSSSGICSPSRYALLTGRYHWRRMYGIVQAFGPSAFEENEFTMARMFKEQGYRTACFGKWHLGWDWESLKKPGVVSGKGNVSSSKRFEPDAFDWSKPLTGGPLSQGFDHYYGDGTINFPPYAWIDGDRIVEAPAVPLDLGGREPPEGRWEFRDGPMVEGWDPWKVLPTITEKAVGFISAQTSDTPFFLYFPLTAPHAPIIPNEEFLGKSDAGPFGDLVVQVDWIVGQVMKTLEEKGLAGNTIVIFTADNGPEKYAFDRLQNFGHWSSGQLRGMKRDTWEGGHRVPFIVRWPGRINAGEVSNSLIHQVDLLATLARVIEYPLSNEMAQDSLNQLPLWLGETAGKPIRDHAVHNTAEDRFAIRKNDWVLIDSKSGEHSKAPDWYLEKTAYVPDAPEGGWLFNLKDDLSQKTNQYVNYPELVAEMKAQLNDIRQNGRSVTR